MSIERWFRLSQYLTLGLSCGALVFAEAQFLPDLQYCLAPVLALLFLAWCVEGGWTLPNWGANILGLLIAAGGVVWVVMQLSDENSVLAQIPLHLALLPYMGPLSIAALLVKVFRTHDVGHFWHLQGWGLLQIGLGCLLDGGPAFGAMMTLYLASDLVCLALHYRLSASKGITGEYRAGSTSCRVERVPSPATHPAASRSTTPWGLFSFSLRWTVLVSATAYLLFLLTPRGDNWSWVPLTKLRTGFSRSRSPSSGEEMNLNHIGRIEIDDEVALHVTAVDAEGNPKLDLSAEQRWRGIVLDWYEHGKWTTNLPAPRSPPIPQKALPNFGPDQFFLTFTVQPRQAGGLVLAEPIRLGPPTARLPVVSLDGEIRRDAEGRRLPRHLFLEQSGTVLSQVPPDQRREYHYRQVLPASGDSYRTFAAGVWLDELPRLMSLPQALRPALQRWTVELLKRLSKNPNYRLPKDVRAVLADPPDLLPLKKEDWETVARTLTHYMAHSGEYHYSLELTRNNRTMDPVLDFLINVKRGHCERYAAALALMLRSVGIPARIVKGFRGCESEGEGRYVVRHSHAHAWVEVPVPRGGWRSYDWLTLDATPPEPSVPVRRFSLTHLWEEIQNYCLHRWRALILEYDGDEQADLWETLISLRAPSLLMKLGLAVLGCGAVLVVWLFLRRFRRRVRVAAVHGDAAVYTRLVQILGRYVSLCPICGQTPLEFGTMARTFLQSRPTLAALAELPMRVVRVFYRVRFGGQRMNEGERQEIDADLGQLTHALNFAQPARGVSEGGPR